jgi:hypothetical protein
MQVGNMKEADDEEPTRWTSIGWQTALILNRLKNRRDLLELAEEKHQDRQRDTESRDADEQKRKDHSDYVDQRLKDLAAFERRVSGEDAPRRKKY